MGRAPRDRAQAHPLQLGIPAEFSRGALARHFRTSQVTIRKDLSILQADGRIHRSHGGALPVQESALEDPTLREKEKLHRKEKLQIASAAAGMVKEGQVVILDSGTTTTAIARALRGIEKLTIITNAVNIAVELAGSPGFSRSLAHQARPYDQSNSLRPASSSAKRRR